MKIGDIIYAKLDKRYGMLIAEDWYSNIGTPFDWCALWFDDGSLWGVDTRDLELISASR